jgi:hypothetical protein
MKKQLWQGLLVAGIAAFAVPSFVQGQAAGQGSSGGSGMTSGSSGASGMQGGTGSGTPGMGSSGIGAGSSGTRSGMPGTSDATGTTGMTSSPAGSMARDVGTSEADKRLNTQIRQSLNADTSLSGVGQNVQLSTQNGKVTLRGSVSSEAEKRQIEQKVKQMNDVDNVDNQLQVASSGSPSSMGSSPGTSSSMTNPSGSSPSTGRPSGSSPSTMNPSSSSPSTSGQDR